MEEEKLQEQEELEIEVELENDTEIAQYTILDMINVPNTNTLLNVEVKEEEEE